MLNKLLKEKLEDYEKQGLIKKPYDIEITASSPREINVKVIQSIEKIKFTLNISEY